jgi:hypothetical protein
LSEPPDDRLGPGLQQDWNLFESASDNGVPFYVAAPSPSIDFSLTDGSAGVPIETRSEFEVTHIGGLSGNGRMETVRIAPHGSKASNYAFDVTPARLVTGLITERGVIAANKNALASAFADRITLKELAAPYASTCKILISRHILYPTHARTVGGLLRRAFISLTNPCQNRAANLRGPRCEQADWMLLSHYALSAVSFCIPRARGWSLPDNGN